MIPRELFPQQSLSPSGTDLVTIVKAMPTVRFLLLMLLVLVLVSWPVFAACSCSMPWLQNAANQKDLFSQMKAAASKSTKPIDLSGFPAANASVSDNPALKSRIMVPQVVKTVLPVSTKVAGVGKDLSLVKLKNRTYSR